MTASITIPAHAKVNLALAVGPPEPATAQRPGWHKIASWMSCIDLADELTLTRLPDGSPSTHSITWAADAPRPTPIDWPIEKDLAVRAHRLLEQHTGRSLPIDLRLAKRIPVGGGLGGGSSDAAAMLMGLNELFGLGIPLEKLQHLGSQLGSDVVFFVDEPAPARPALVTGFGDVIERVPFIAADLLLVIPPFGCATGPVYAAYDDLLRERIAARSPLTSANPPGGPPDEAGFRAVIARATRVEGGHNDLLGAACRVEPALAGLISAALQTTWRHPTLTGSGSCFYIAYAPDKREHLDAAERRLRAVLDSATEPGDARTPAAGCRLIRTSLC